MKKTVLIGFGVIVALLFSCKKEDRFYNDDGSPITMAQALEIVKDKVDYYDWVEISTEVIKGGSIFTNNYNGIDAKFKVPYDSWIVMINTEPLANSGRFWLFIYVNAYTGKYGQTSMQWHIPQEFNSKLVKKTGFVTTATSR